MAVLSWVVAVVAASLRIDVNFRTSWMLDIASRLAQFLITVLFFDLLYGQRETLGGVSWSHMLVLLGTYQLVRTLSDTFFAEVNRLPDKIARGTLDFDLLKPIGSRLRVSVGRIRATRLLELAAAGWFLHVGLGGLSLAPNWFAYSVLVVTGVYLKYSLTFIMNCLSFWVIRTYGLYGLFDQLYDLARYPASAFSKAVRGLLFYLLPIFVMVNLPVAALLQGLTAEGLFLVVSQVVLWETVSRLVWHLGLRSYVGASG